MLRPVIAVVGPTAAGKSDLSLLLARALDGEVVNADSMQLYRGMDIGTAKLTEAERGGVPHHLLDIWPVTRAASVSEYQVLARAAIADIQRRGKTAILVGGSGLYVRAAIDDLQFPGTDADLRASLEDELARVGPGALHARLAAQDPAAAAAILPSNGRRIVRALEVIRLSGRPFTATLPDYESVFPAIQIGVTLPRAELDRRVAGRVDRMWQLGLVGEVRRLVREGLRDGPDGQPRAGIRAGAAVPGWRVDRGGGGRPDRPGDAAVRPAAGVVVPPRPAGQMAARSGTRGG